MIPFLYQLQGATFTKLSSLDFKVAVVDMDESNLTLQQVGYLKTQGKTMLTYLSIGEAEDYRDYWSANGLKPKTGFVLSENPDWEGNFLVKFWDPAWQNIMMARAKEAVDLGYSGMYLDIVDAYEVSRVRRTYTGADIRQEMIKFVVKLSQYTKGLNPGFKVIPQNAVGLYALKESNAGVPNGPYLAAIDGAGCEDLWFDGNTKSDWTNDDLAFLKNVTNAGKWVLSTSYPTQAAKQKTYITSALGKKLIPFCTDRNLTGKIPAINQTVFAQIDSTFNKPW